MCDGGDCEWKLAGVELGREGGMGDGGESREGVRLVCSVRPNEITDEMPEKFLSFDSLKRPTLEGFQSLAGFMTAWNRFEISFL